MPGLVLRVADLQHGHTVGLLAVLAGLFGGVDVVKPLGSAPHAAEKFVVGTAFRGLADPWRAALLRLAPASALPVAPPRASDPARQPWPQGHTATALALAHTPISQLPKALGPSPGAAPIPLAAVPAGFLQAVEEVADGFAQQEIGCLERGLRYWGRAMALVFVCLRVLLAFCVSLSSCKRA